MFKCYFRWGRSPPKKIFRNSTQILRFYAILIKGPYPISSNKFDFSRFFFLKSTRAPDIRLNDRGPPTFVSWGPWSLLLEPLQYNTRPPDSLSWVRSYCLTRHSTPSVCWSAVDCRGSCMNSLAEAVTTRSVWPCRHSITRSPDWLQSASEHILWIMSFWIGLSGYVQITSNQLTPVIYLMKPPIKNQSSLKPSQEHKATFCQRAFDLIQ